jgi:YfiR/HmsC-like
MKKAITILLMFCSFLFLPHKIRAQQYDFKENAVYVYNFIKYTGWPGIKSNLIIGIIGKTKCETELRSLVLKKKNSNVTFTIKNITSADAENVDAVLIAASASDEISSIQASTAGLPILIISEKEDTNGLGACISFFADEDEDFKTKYQLSLKNCRTRGLTVSAQIISNATLVR